MTTLTNASVKLVANDGNAFSALGRVRSLGRVRAAILKSDKPELVESFMEEAMSGDYDHLLRTCMKYVEVY